MKLPWTQQPAPPASAPFLDLAAAEREFREKFEIGRTESGSLAVRGGGGWRSTKRGELERWLHDWLIEHSITHLWTSGLVDDFRSFLTAGADPLPRNATVNG